MIDCLRVPSLSFLSHKFKNFLVYCSTSRIFKFSAFVFNNKQNFWLCEMPDILKIYSKENFSSAALDPTE